jgi:Ca-activated chloride channel homolog
MNWKFHRGYGGFVLGLGAVSLALAACTMADLEGTASCPGSGAGSAAVCDFGGSGVGSNSSSGIGGTGGVTIPEVGGMGNFGPTDKDAGSSSGGGNSPQGDAGVPPPPEEDGSAGSGLAGCAELDPTQPKILYVSADDSNSMGSPGYAREVLKLGFEPSPARIRTYEFLNYYRIAYPAPEFGKLDIFAEMAIAHKPEIADFQFAIRSYDAPSRRPMNFTFLIDTSGSMKGPGILRAKEAVKAIASQLVANDIVSFVTTDELSPVKLDGFTVVGANDPKITEILDALTTGGTTDLTLALTNAFDIAKNHRSNQRMNRVIFISDGGVNVGVTDPDLIKERSKDAESEGIYLVGIGTGPVLTYNDKLMNDVTDAGRGAYVYINSAEEATHMLEKRFDETMDIAARSVQVKLTLPWYFKVQPVSTEDASEVTKVEPQHLAPSDAMVFLLQTTVCDPLLYNTEDPVTIRVSWNTRDGFDSQVTEKTVPLKQLFLDKSSPAMLKTRAIVAYAEALKQCGFDKDGYSLCKSEVERRQTIKENLLLAKDLATAAKNGMADAELDEILDIIANHPLIKP